MIDEETLQNVATKQADMETRRDTGLGVLAKAIKTI